MVEFTPEGGCGLLDHPLIQARLHLPPDQVQQRPESQMEHSFYDCPQIPVGPEGTLYRVVMAIHSAGKKKSPVGLTRAGVVYELFFTNLPQHAVTACDVVELYLHRGAFEPILSDEDSEQDPDRWCSHSAWGQECWQLISQSHKICNEISSSKERRQVLRVSRCSQQRRQCMPSTGQDILSFCSPMRSSG